MPEAAMTAKDAVGGLAAPLDDSRAAVDGHATIGDASPPVILSKVRIPRQRPVMLGRGRLLGWLDQHAADRVVTVAAEVGYGKSTLLADYARRSGVRCAWYRVEESDADWISFLGHMVAAIRVALPGFGTSTEALLRHVAAVGPTRDIVTSSLLAEMSDLPAERTLVVLDDFHLVGDSDDVRSILRRLLESAPDDWHFAIATRGRPTLPIGRVAAQGSVAELTTQELRFTRAEVGELFDLYLHQLSAEALDIVYERTQGWAASLQLVLASVAASRPSEVEPFIAGLSGAQGPIHDFLAQEVLARLDETTERVLVHASLLDRVTPALVTAALSVTASPVDPPTASRCLVEAEELGLLVTADDSNAGSRFHPLLRDFLRDQLERTALDGQVASMHVAIAVAAEDDDWLAAGSHYARGGKPDEAMRVLGAAAYKALGTGAWGAATAVAALTSGVEPPPAVEVIRARALIADGRAAEALALLDGLRNQALPAHDEPLLSVTRSAALHYLGRIEELTEEVARIDVTSSQDSAVGRIGRAWSLMAEAFKGGSIGQIRPALVDLGDFSAGIGMHYFAGIAYHNEATAALAQADFAAARAMAVRARNELSISQTDVVPSSLMTEALAEIEGGNTSVGLALAREATTASEAHPDVLADGAYLACLYGNLELATALGLRLKRALLESQVQVGLQTQAAFAEATYLSVLGQYRAALQRIEVLGSTGHDDFDRATRFAFVSALLSVLLRTRDARHRVLKASQACDQQQAWRWQQRLRILESVVTEDWPGLRREVSLAASKSELSILETADAIGGVLDNLDPLPEDLLHSIARHPRRWLPVLTRQVERRDKASGRLSAQLLADFGTLDQLLPLVEYERAVGARSRRRTYSKDLVRRASPTLRVHDLGRTWYEIAGRSLRSSDSRRKASTLLLYLVTRPKQTATREQIMEDLWPDQAPDSALNSLHQTLHFVRRDIAPWVEEGITADYVPMGLELVFLDPELVQIDSVAFLRQATATIAGPDLTRQGPDLFRLYTGRFAPEFEYEEWAADWRTLVHTTFLHLAHATAQSLLDDGQRARAAEILTRALEVEPGAFNLHVSLVRTLAALGGKDAAVQQYQRFEAIVQRDVGVTPPSLEEILLGGELVDLA